MFLAVFLSMYVYTMQGGYSTQIEMTAQNELRVSSVFAALALSGEDINDETAERMNAMNFGEHNENFVAVRSDDGFAILGTPHYDISVTNDLLFSAWEGQSSVTAIRGDYKYGVTVIVDSNFQVAALAVVRQLSTILTDEMRDATIDFLLAMSATVFAFVFLFVEVNRILEVINIPNMKRERSLRYAKGLRSLMFIITACRYIPLYFFVLIVQDIYEHNPASWLPGDVATVLPIAVVLLLMAVGRDITARIIRVRPRKMLLLGCFIGTAGFTALSLGVATTLPVLLLLLMFTYTGLSLTYNGLWDYASDAADSGYGEFADTREHTLSGEYLGGTAGAVIGAMVFDKFGLSAAFALSAAILIVLAILLRSLLTSGDAPYAEQSVKSKTELGFLKFFFSKHIFLFMLLLLMPFVLGEYFIEQFSPLYASAIELSPGAASWTCLLMTMTLAYISPGIVQLLSKRFSTTAITVTANLIAAGGLVLFAVYPGLVTLYAASGLIGISMGVGKNIIAARFTELSEVNIYKHSGSVYNLFDSLFGLLGAALFTLVFIISAGGTSVIIIGIAIAVATLMYLTLSKRKET
jgi:hypothetical protein